MFSPVILTVIVISGITGFLSSMLVIAERLFINYGDCTIVVNNDKQLNVKGGSSLLSTLNQQKIFLPSACGGRGTCAFCKCKIVKGAGTLLPTELPLLSQEEIKNQIRIACQVKVKQDMAIEIPEALFQIQEFTSEVTLIYDLTYDIKLIRLQLIQPENITFKSGQYIQLQTPPYDGVKENVSRAYSIASPYYETHFIDLMIRFVPEGICTTWVHRYLKKGDTVQFTGPMGEFYYHEGSGEIIMVAGGSGMAPIASLLSEIARKQIERKVTFFFGAVTKRDLFYLDEIMAFQKSIDDFTFIPVLSQPDPKTDWQGETGLITVPLENYLKQIDGADCQVYMCGSPGMLDACLKILKQYEIEESRIFYDPFA